MPISRSQTASAATLEQQCFRDDPRDRLSFPSKDGLLNHGRGGSQSSSAANLAQPTMWHSVALLCFVTTSWTTAFPVL